MRVWTLPVDLTVPWFQKQVKLEVDWYLPPVRRSSYTYSSTSHPMLISYDQVILWTQAVNKCTTWADPWEDCFEEYRDRLFPRWAVRGTVSPRSASSCRRTSVQRQSDVMSMTRRQTSEDHAPPRYSLLFSRLLCGLVSSNYNEP